MNSIRDIKRKARLDLHEHMKVEVFHIAAQGVDPVSIHARIHNKWDALTMANGRDGQMTSRNTMPTRLVFLLSELVEKSVVLRRKGIISVEPGEAYRLENAETDDLITVTWNVTVLPSAEAAGLPVPDGNG